MSGSSDPLDTRANIGYVLVVRMLTLFFLAGASALAQTAGPFGSGESWTTTNQVAPYSATVHVPQVNVPQVTIPQPATVQIPAATNAPAPPRKPARRDVAPYLTAPTIDNMARGSMILKPPVLPEPPPQLLDTNVAPIPTAPLALTNAPAAVAPWPATGTSAGSE